MGGLKKLALLRAGLIAIIPGIAVAFFMSFVAISHNPMGELFIRPSPGELEYNFGYLVLIWISWFFPVFLIVFGIFALGGLAKNKLENKPNGNKFYKQLRKTSPKLIWAYSGAFSALISSVPATFLYLTAIDPGHYRNEFCLEKLVGTCKPDFGEISMFLAFWFFLTFLFLFPLLGSFLVLKAKD